MNVRRTRLQQASHWITQRWACGWARSPDPSQYSASSLKGTSIIIKVAFQILLLNSNKNTWPHCYSETVKLFWKFYVTLVIVAIYAYKSTLNTNPIYSYIQTYSHAHCIAYMDISEPNIWVCYLTNVQRYGQHVLSEFDGMVIRSHVDRTKMWNLCARNINACMHACMHACIRTYTYIHIYICTYTHIYTYKYAYISTYIPSWSVMLSTAWYMVPTWPPSMAMILSSVG